MISWLKRVMNWMLCVGVLAASCLLQAACQKTKLPPACASDEEDSIRLYSERVFDNRTEGQVLMCEDGFWRRICDKFDGWTKEDAQVACRELGFSDGNPHQLDPQLWTADLPSLSSTVPTCNGSESAIADCPAEETPQNADCDSVAVGVQCVRHLQSSAAIFQTADDHDVVPLSIEAKSVQTWNSNFVPSASSLQHAISISVEPFVALTELHANLTKPGAPTGPNSTAQLAVGIAGGIILAVVGGLVVLTAFVCMKKRKSESLQAVSTAPNPAYDNPQAITSIRGQVYSEAEATTGEVFEEGYEMMVAHRELSCQQTDTLSEGYTYVNEEGVPTESNPAYTAEIHVYDVISGSTSRPPAQGVDSEHNRSLLPQPGEDYEVMLPAGAGHSTIH